MGLYAFYVQKRKGFFINLYQIFLTLNILFESLRGYKKNLVWGELIEIFRATL
jgi:hypothetical protein